MVCQTAPSPCAAARWTRGASRDPTPADLESCRTATGGTKISVQVLAWHQGRIGVRGDHCRDKATRPRHAARCGECRGVGLVAQLEAVGEPIALFVPEMLELPVERLQRPPALPASCWLLRERDGALDGLACSCLCLDVLSLRWGSSASILIDAAGLPLTESLASCYAPQPLQ